MLRFSLIFVLIDLSLGCAPYFNSAEFNQQDKPRAKWEPDCKEKIQEIMDKNGPFRFRGNFATGGPNGFLFGCADWCFQNCATNKKKTAAVEVNGVTVPGTQGDTKDNVRIQCKCFYPANLFFPKCTENLEIDTVLELYEAQCVTKPDTATSGAASDGATSDGATSDGATSDGATSDGATSDGATSDGASSDGATSDGATSDGATSDGATSDGATSDGATSDGATSDGATSDGATSDGATSDGATSDGATSDGATSDGATSDGATSDGATSDGATSDATAQ